MLFGERMQQIERWLIVVVFAVHAAAVAAVWQQDAAPTAKEPVVMQAVLLSPPAPVQTKPTPTPAAPKPSTTPVEKKPIKPQVKSTVAPPKRQPAQQKTPVTTKQVAAVQASPTSRSAAAVAAPPSYQAPSAEAQGLNNTAPAYPPTSRKKREQGVVWLEVHVGVQGELLEIKLKTSSGFSRLDDAALRAVKQWRFQPALRDGKAVDAWYDLPVRFSLTGL